MSRFIEGLQHLASSKGVRLTLAGGAALGTTAFSLPDCSPSQTVQKPPITTEGTMPSQDLQIIENFRGFNPEQQRNGMRTLTQRVDELGTKYLYSKTPEDAKTTYDELAQSLTDKALLLQLHPQTFTALRVARVVVEPSKRVVAVDNEKYDLNKPSDFVMASALINSYGRFHVRGLAEDINDLHKKVSLDLGGSPVGNLESLSRLSQTLKVFENKGKPIPQKVRYPYIPIYIGDSPLPAEYQWRGMNKDVYGVVNFQLADFYLKHEQGPYAEYKKAVEREFNNPNNPPMVRPELAGAAQSSLLRSGEQDFTATFVRYFTDGVSLRKRIAYAEARGLVAEHRILSAKYNALRQWFGDEIQANGVIKSEEGFRVGDFLWIDDYVARHYYELGGIYLRPEPTLKTNPDLKVMIQGANVRIIDGPATVIDDGKEEAMTMWKVEAGDFLFDNKSFAPWGNDWEGWVSDEWFSRKPVQR